MTENKDSRRNTLVTEVKGQKCLLDIFHFLCNLHFAEYILYVQENVVCLSICLRCNTH